MRVGLDRYQLRALVEIAQVGAHPRPELDDRGGQAAINPGFVRSEVPVEVAIHHLEEGCVEPAAKRMRFEGRTRRRSRILIGHLSSHARIVEYRTRAVRRRSTSLWRLRCHPPCGDLGSGANAESGPDPVDVTFRRAFIDAEPMSDLPVGQTLADQVCHLTLSSRESRNSGLAKCGKPEKATDLADQGVDGTDVGKV